MEQKQDKFEVLTGRLQILRRPQMWIGAVTPVKQKMFVISDGRAEQKEIEYVPAFRKIIDEILDNSLDALIEHRDSTGVVKVKIDDKEVYIEDNGPGIPVVKKKLSDLELANLPKEEAKQIQDSYLPQLAWTRLFSGSNFQDSAEKTTIGSHGVGSTATAIFSRHFIGHTDDGKKACTVKADDNMEKVSCRTSQTSGKPGTWVKFEPDLEKFGLSKIEKIYSDILYQRLLCLAITFPKIKFTFNGERVSIDPKKFLKMFSEFVQVSEFSKGFVGIYPSDADEFGFFTYVNGMHFSRGGKHIEYLDRLIINPVRDKLVKKYKTIKPADIRNHLNMVVFFRDFPNAKFDSQTKDTLTNTDSDISAYLNSCKFDAEKLAKDILKCNEIIEPIVDMFKLKEELKARKELKNVKKAKVKSDKYFLGEGKKKYLFLVEGLSAAGGLMKCLGRKEKFYYALRGLALNVYNSSIQKISANQEVKDVLNILDLDMTKGNDEKQDIEFEKIVIATDQDLDGINITSMLLGWWKKLAPSLFTDHHIYKLNTPIVILKDNKDNIKKWFFFLDDFKKWEKENPNSKLKILYLKGLGSLDVKDLKTIIDSTPDGFDGLLQEYYLDEESDKLFDDWLGDDAEPRKEYLRNYNLDIDLV